MYGHGATCRTSGASRPTPSAPAVAAMAARHQASHVRSAAIDVRRAWSSSEGGRSAICPSNQYRQLVADDEEVLALDGHEVRLSSPGKRLFGERGETKRDL